jgi:hypothetical protein
LCCGYKFNSKYDAIKINLSRGLKFLLLLIAMKIPQNC